MSRGQRVLRRSRDGRVSVSWRPDDPVRMFVREADGTVGEIDLSEFVVELARLGAETSPPDPGGVELGWVSASGDVRFVIGGRRLAVAAGLELVAAGVVDALVAAIGRLPEENSP